MENMYLNGPEFEKPMSLVSPLNTVFKHKKLIISLFLMAVAIVSIVTYKLTPVYRASSKLLLEREVDSEKLLLLGTALRDGYERYDWIESEINIIKSRPVICQVVGDLKLDQIYFKDRISSPDIDAAKCFERTVAKVEEKLNVEKERNSNVVGISYEDKDPELAVAVVERIVDTYMKKRLEISDGTQSYEFFQEQTRIADEKLRELEKRQIEYKRQRGVISPEDQKAILLARLADYESSLTDVRTRRIGREAKLAVIKEHQRNGGELRIPSTESADSPSRLQHIAKLESDLLDAELQREILLQKFTPQYEEVVNLDKQIEAMKGRIRREVKEIIDMEEASIRALKAEESALQVSIEGIKNEMQEFAQDEYELNQLSRDIDENLEVLTIFSKQREEARISMAKLERGVKVKVISPAFASTDPVKPQKARTILIGLCFSLLGSFGLAFLLDYIDHSVTTPYELEKNTELTVLGSVREINLGKSGAEIEGKSKVG
ncbi:MAG: GumC family protein [Candidatus Glassbacteria bacterium]